VIHQQHSCVVLGGGGFIGVNLCRRLIRTGYRVRVIDRHCSFPECLAGSEWIPGDFSDAGTLGAAIEPGAIVFHLVHTTLPQTANLDMVGDVEGNVIPSLRLLELCRKIGAARIVFVSSAGTVYGCASDVPTPETAATNPITAYGISKLSIEKYLALYEHLHRLDYRILRVANPYGPFQVAHRNQGLIAAILSRSLQNQSCEVWGDGSVVRDFVFIDDVTDALLLAAVDKSDERIFNIGSGRGLSLREVIAAIESQLGSKLHLDWKRGRPVDVPISIISVNRATKTLGWHPKTSFDAGLAETIAWWRARLSTR
jgi:UDP-glucose 4-epimerase